MMIVNRKTFLSLPKGTVYSEFYESDMFNDLCIKTSEPGEYSNDWRYLQLNEFDNWDDSGERYDRIKEMKEQGSAYYNEYDSTSRDGMFDEDQWFAVYAISDVEKMIEALTEAINPKTASH